MLKIGKQRDEQRTTRGSFPCYYGIVAKVETVMHFKMMKLLFKIVLNYTSLYYFIKDSYKAVFFW